MKKLIPGWIHQPGWHCASTVISDVMNFKGVAMSEARCFGLGAGLGFAYIEGDSLSPTRMTAVRNRNLEQNFFSCLDLPSAWLTDPDPEKSLESLKEYIEKDIPVLIRADIFHLDYYKSKSHFSGHVVCVWGFDDALKEVYVADTEWPGLQAVSYDSIKNARFGNIAGYYRVQADHMPMDFKVSKPRLREAARIALIRQADDLENPELGRFVPMGFEGMERAAQRLPEWTEAEDWSWCARWFYQVIERRGTGGGAFRRMYSIFLDEIASLDECLFRAAPSEEMAEIADGWTRLSNMLKDISERPEPGGFEKPAALLESLAGKERNFFNRVRREISD